VLAEARKRPGTLFIGIDPVQALMADAARRAAAKPSRGGVPNALFLQSSLESLPHTFEEIADQITVNYPWGSLLRAAALPDLDLLSRLAAIAKHGRQVEIHIHIHPFWDPAYAARIGLGHALLIASGDAFHAAYARAGLVVREIADVSANPCATRWGKQLKHGAREILRVRATRM